MRTINPLKNALWAIFLAFYALSSQAADLPVSELTQNEPILKGTLLPDETYVEVKTKRFSQARVVWLNFAWLKENGFSYPQSGLVPEFESQVLDALAYGVPRASDDPSLFTDQTKTFYADRYGGTGIGVNYGSGRAASRGWVQIKGIGVTPLVGNGQGFDHAHGGASMEEAMREAMWGEINHHELPYGSNRVIAIIDTGTYTQWKDGGREKRALIVREDPLRPAHFMYSQSDSAAETARLQRTAQNAPKLMREVLGGGNYLEYVRRVAKQYAAAYARKLFHGATSESNFDFTGRFLDFGTQTSLPSYQAVHVLRHVAAFGKIDEIKETLVKRPLGALEDFNPRLKLPSTRQAMNEFEAVFTEALHFEMLLLTGAPPELLKRISKTKEYLRLASDLIEYTQTEWSVPKYTVYDRASESIIQETRLGQLLENCAGGSSASAAIEQLAPQVSSDLKKRFARNYPEFLQRLKNEARTLQISELNLSEYMNNAARIRNERRPMLERPGTIWRNIELITQYMNDGNRSPIWDQINQVIERSLRQPRMNRPFYLALEHRIDYLSGVVNRQIYDLKTGNRFWEAISIRELVKLSPQQVVNCSVLLGGNAAPEIAGP